MNATVYKGQKAMHYAAALDRDKCAEALVRYGSNK